MSDSSAPMCSSEDTHASHLALRGKEVERAIRDICGQSVYEPYAYYDPATQCLRMYEATLVSDFPRCLATLPPSGSMQSGKLYQQARLVRHTAETGFSSWPTPTAIQRPNEGNVRLYRAKVQAGQMSEQEAEAILGKSVWEAQGKLPRMWPTPTTWEGRRGAQKDPYNSGHQITLTDAVRGVPNPMWVEWLMGFPLGWTDLEP